MAWHCLDGRLQLLRMVDGGWDDGGGVVLEGTQSHLRIQSWPAQCVEHQSR